MVFLLLAGILISSSVLAYVMNKRGTAVLLSFERDRSSLLAGDIARELKDAMLLDKKPSIIKTLVTSNMMDADVRTALFTGDGTLYAGQTDHRVPGEIFSDPRDMSITSEGRLIFFKPLLNEQACRQCHVQGREVLGIVMVDISSKKMTAVISEIRRTMILFTVSLAVLGSLVLILILKKMVFSPLAVLHEAAKKVGAGELQYRIDLPHKDEFGTVASAFNRMAGSIEKSHATLEESVRQRTAELEEAANRYRESETRLKEAQRIAKMGNWKLDAENMTFWWSDETFKIFGKDQAEPVSFSSFLESVHPEDREPLSRSVEHVIASGQTEWSYDYRIVLKGGEVRYLHAEGRAHLDESGAITERIGTVQDITERKKIEAALYTLVEEVSGKTDRDFFRSLVERLVRTLGMDFAYVGELLEDMNHVWTIAVYAHGEFGDNFTYCLEGTPCDKVVWKKLCLYPKNVRELFPGDTLLMEMGAEGYIGIPLFASSGKPLGIIAALSSRPMTDLKFVEFVFNMFAIRATSELERMQSNRLLKSQKELSDAIFDSTASGIMVLDDKGTVLRINRAGAALFRSNADDLAGKNLAEIYPETRLFLMVDQALRDEVILSNRDGSITPIGFSTSLLRNAHGTEAGVIVLFRDLSETKKLEASLKKKEHFETMGKVVSGVAHEVRNPLFGITSIGQILEREIETPQHRALISAMLKETTRMKNLIEELLMYTRPSRLDIRTIDLNLLLMELEHHVNGKRPGITVSMEAPLPVTISADRDKITQVLLNLLHNAIEAAGTIVSVNARPMDDHIEITIHDDGPGIPLADRERIFEPFFTTKKGGTGLGLPICKKLVEDHGGTLEIASTEGSGTTVMLVLRV